MDRTAVFEFFVRRLPPRRGFLIAASLTSVVEYLERAAKTVVRLANSRVPEVAQVLGLNVDDLVAYIVTLEEPCF